jgi:hypothetical protein
MPAEQQFTGLYSDAGKPGWIRERAAQDLARTRQAEKDFSSAAATYRQFIADFPESQGVEEALYHLTELALKADAVGDANAATDALRVRNKNSPWMAEALREHIYQRRKQNFAWPRLRSKSSNRCRRNRRRNSTCCLPGQSCSPIRKNLMRRPRSFRQ